MKKLQLLSFVLLTCIFQVGYSRKAEKKEVSKSKTQKKVEEVENKINEANETVLETGEAVKNSINTTEETVEEVKDAITDIFGKKKERPKNIFTIAVLQTDLSNKSVHQLSNYITKKKLFKSIGKSFKTGNVSINIVTKKESIGLG